MINSLNRREKEHLCRGPLGFFREWYGQALGIKFGLVFFVFGLMACEKEELPVPRHESGDVTTSTVSLDPTYKWQVYFDLETNREVGRNLKTAWDLGFETSADGYHIVLNASKFMMAGKSAKTDFAQVTDTIGFGLAKNIDAATGNLDSTAFGDWRNGSPVYIVDRGVNEFGLHQGFRKVQVQGVDAHKFTVRFAQLNGTNETTLEVPKDSTYNLTFLSFAKRDTVHIEPPKKDWDLAFTQFNHVFYEPVFTQYLVTGCLLNRYHTHALMDSTVRFEGIDFAKAQSYNLSSNLNAIGFDWKSYTGSVYITHTKMNYIIRDQNGLYYKLRFIDFYDAGKKGSPKWEFQKL